MQNETFNNENKPLFNINKTNIVLGKKLNFSSFKSIEEKNDKNLILSKIRLKSKNTFVEKNDSKKEIPPSPFKTNKIIKNTSDNNLESNFLNNDETFRTINESQPLNDKDIDKKNNNKMKQFKSFNINTYNKQNKLKVFDLSKSSIPERKISLHKKINGFNDINNIVKEEEKTDNNNKLFSTEINFDDLGINNKKLKNSKNKVNISTFNDNDSKNNASTFSSRNSKKTKYEDPLLIPKEDMIFEEMKKYKCFKYFTKEEMEKTGVPFIYIQMNMNPNKTATSWFNQNSFFDKSFKDKKYLQKLIKTGKEGVYLSKRHNMDMTDERKKEILSNIYRIKTAPDLYKRIEINKTKKDKKKLKNYQNNFLKIVKHNITNKFYESLKDKFGEIREEAEGKYNTNFKYLREIEKNEEHVINSINEICHHYTRFFATKNINKLFVKSIGPRLKLPKLKFIQMAKKEFFSEDEKNNKIKKRNLKKYMNKTNFRFNKDELSSIQNQNSNKDILFTSTKYNKFSNLKTKSSKTIN